MYHFHKSRVEQRELGAELDILTICQPWRHTGGEMYFSLL